MAILATRGTALNEGGIAVYTDFELTIGEQVELELTPPFSGLSLRVRGVVRSRASHCCGLEFIAADAGERRKLSLLRQMLQYGNETTGTGAVSRRELLLGGHIDPAC
jgi:hypothetical protein